jgi:hypothetical protein
MHPTSEDDKEEGLPTGSSTLRLHCRLLPGQTSPAGEFGVIADANENLAEDTFTSTKYKAKHDLLEMKAHSSSY